MLGLWSSIVGLDRGIQAEQFFEPKMFLSSQDFRGKKLRKIASGYKN
jgi:hypothetical protein